MNGFMKTKLILIISIVLVLNSCKKDENVFTTTRSAEGGEKVEFSISDEWKLGSYNSVLWEFGDGTTSSEKNPTHVYKNAGRFIVHLSVLSSGGKVKRQITPFIVNVEQLIKPRILDINAEHYWLDYLYINEEMDFSLVFEQEVQDNIDDYSFKITIDSTYTFSDRFCTHTFTDSGYHQIVGKIYDKNGVSGTFEKMLHVGSEQSYINCHIANANLSPLGSITERYVIVYNSTNPYSYSNDLDDFLAYPGPNATNPLINNGELMDYYGPGYYDYFYWDFDSPMGYIAPWSVNDGDYYQIPVPAFDGTIDRDELRIVHLIVGTNGLNISTSLIQITPGFETQTFELPVPTYYAY